MTKVREYIDKQGVKWLSTSDIARKIGRTRYGLYKQAKQLEVAMTKIRLPEITQGRRDIAMMKESDVARLLTSMREVGEFADSFKHIKDNVTNKGLEAIKPTSKIKHFQRFPDPTVQVPEKPIRASIVEYIRKVAITMNANYSAVFTTLYTEFKYRYGIDLTKHKGYPTCLDKAMELEKLPDLYALARKMFDSKLPDDELILLGKDDYDCLPAASH